MRPHVPASATWVTFILALTQPHLRTPSLVSKHQQRTHIPWMLYGRWGKTLQGMVAKCSTVNQHWQQERKSSSGCLHAQRMAVKDKKLCSWRESRNRRDDMEELSIIANSYLAAHSKHHCCCNSATPTFHAGYSIWHDAGDPVRMVEVVHWPIIRCNVLVLIIFIASK